MNVRSLPVAGTLSVALLGLAAMQGLAGGLQPQGGEIQLTRGIPGDQVNPALVLTATGGWLVWQDAAVDGDGLGIAAAQLLPGGGAVSGSVVALNATKAGDQENPAIAALPNGSALVVWQSGNQGFQRIVGRLLTAGGTAVPAADIAISAGNGEHQVDPAVATLADGSAVVVWSSYRQNESFSYDVFARRILASGQPAGEEFRVNSTTGMNRRTPAVTALPSGGFLVGWIGERYAGSRSLNNDGVRVTGDGSSLYEVGVFTRAFSAEGLPVASEQRVSGSDAIASNPALVTLADGHVVAAWTRRDPVSLRNSLDVSSRLLGPTGAPEGDEQRVNTTMFGDQYRPRLSVSAHGVLAVWSSMGQDGSWEGVYGRWIDETGKPVGDEIPINGQTGGGQLLPAVASDSAANLLVAWSSNLPRSGYELFAQRYAPLLLKAVGAGPGRLKLSWATVLGGVYQLQSSQDGSTWNNLSAARAASDGSDAVELSVSGQMVLYRVIRAR